MHRLRSILTTLGIIFGVASVIAMLAIGEGASRQAQQQIARLGSKNIIIQTIKPPEQQDASARQESMLEYGLTYADAERFHNSIHNVEVIVPIRRLSGRAWYRNRKVPIEVIGTVPWHIETSPLQVKKGRFISSIDMDYRRSICVIDERVVRELFSFDEPLNQDVKIASDYYRVVGIISAENPVSGNQDFVNKISPMQRQSNSNIGSIYVPLTTVKDRFGEISLQISGTRSGKIEKVEPFPR